MLLPTLYSVERGVTGWWVTVEVSHSVLAPELGCNGVGLYTLYVEPWR